MKKRIIKIIFFIIILLIVFGFAFRYYLHTVMIKSIPDYNKEIYLTGLIEEVSIYRDHYAIPHIYATNETDLYKVTGYIMAQDRLWQMDLLRRITQGRLAEILGDNLIDVDILFRSLRIPEKSAIILDSSKTEVVSCLEAFTDGVNQFIEQNTDQLPVEFKILGYQPEKWEATHSINLIGYMGWSLRSGWENLFYEEMRSKLDDKKVNELYPEVTIQKDYVFALNEQSGCSEILQIFQIIDNLNLEVFSGSNNWAVSGSKSQSGKPLFANDMHLDYNIPGTWYQMHQVVEGKINVTGVALPGQPLVVAGHNEHIAWGMTNTYVDNVDFYEEKVNPENRNQYELNGEWKDFKVQKEIIQNKKGKKFEKTVRFNHRGPVITDFRENIGKTVTMKWIGNLYSNELGTIFQLNRANNWEDFKEAVKGFITISQNINYADVNGNIGLYCCAGVPVRNRDIAFGFLPGWTDQYDWKGLLPFEELPYQYNPSNGYVSSANNRTINDTYPHHLGTWYAQSYRIQRIREVIENKDNFSPGDFMQLQNDNYSKMAELFTPRITQYIQENINILSKQELVAFNQLKTWDYHFDVNSNMSLLFDQMCIEIISNLVKDEMGDDLFKLFLEQNYLPKIVMENAFNHKEFSFCDDIHTPDFEENFSDIVVKSFKTAIHNISKQYSGDIEKWKWGTRHQLYLQHPMGKVKILNYLLNLNRGPFSLDGSWHTIPQYGYEFSDPFKINHGASQRQIYDLSNWDNSISVMPTGICGNAASIYYSDQTELYVNQKYHEDLFSKKLVVEKAKYTTKVMKADN